MEFILVYFFTWYTYVDGMTIYYASGIGLMRNIPYLFTNAQSIAAGMMMPTFVFYIIVFLFILLLASPILILIGIKRRSTAIIGSILPILIATALLVAYFAEPLIFEGLYFTWDTWGPLYFSPSVQVSGLFFMGIGGIVSFIGGCLGRGPKVKVYKGKERPAAQVPEEPTELGGIKPPKDPLKRRLLTFPIDMSDLPEEVLKPEIYVPIDSSNAKEVIPPDAEIIYSTMMSGEYTFGPLKETWMSHVLITTRGVAFSRPTTTGTVPPPVYFAPWSTVMDPVKGRLSIRISALAFYYFKLSRDPNSETKEDFNFRFKHLEASLDHLRRLLINNGRQKKRLSRRNEKLKSND